MNFGAVSAVDYMTICDDSIDVNKEAAAAREFFAARIERFDGNG
jgi:hypothetical protein